MGAILTSPTWRAALYHRRSTADKNQTPGWAATCLREFIAKDPTIAEVVWAYDSKTGNSALEDREAGGEVLEMVEDGRVNLIVSFDCARLSRERALDALNTVDRLVKKGCAWVSASEPGLDTRLYRFGTWEELIFQQILLMRFGQAHGELQARSAATTAALAVLKQQGGTLGRHVHLCGVPKAQRCDCRKRWCPGHGGGPCPTGVHGPDGRSTKAKAKGRKVPKWRVEPVLDCYAPLALTGSGGPSRT